MSRSRVLSSTNIYHVVLRGINKQTIFFSKEEFKKFIYVLKDCKQKTNIKIHAYCLMDNHIHLLIETTDITISDVMKYMEVRYVKWYNAKNERVGHLFQNRFKSQPIECDRHFICAVRYIHSNPVKAGMVKVPHAYPWSSAPEYIGGSKGLCDKELMRGIMGSDVEMMRFLLEDVDASDDKYMDAFEGDDLLYNEELAQRMLEASGCDSLYEIGKLGKEERDRVILKLLKEKFTQRQISRLCGVSRSTVNRIAQNGTN